MRVLRGDHARGFGSRRSLPCQVGLEGDPAGGRYLAHHDARLRHAAAGIDDDLHDGLSLIRVDDGANGFDLCILYEDEREFEAAISFPEKRRVGNSVFELRLEHRASVYALEP